MNATDLDNCKYDTHPYRTCDRTILTIFCRVCYLLDQPLGSQIPVIFDPCGNKAKGRLDKMNRNGKKLLTLGMVLLVMFVIWTFQRYLVGAGASSLREVIKLFWTFRVPWGWTYTAGTVAGGRLGFVFFFFFFFLVG